MSQAEATAGGGAKEKEGQGGILSDLPTLIVAVAVALAIRTFLYQSFYVPSDSMFPTLLVGDHVFVNKYAYGPRIPFTETRLPALREPRRGEVAVFRLARSGPRVYAADRRPELPTEAVEFETADLSGQACERLDLSDDA